MACPSQSTLDPPPPWQARKAFNVRWTFPNRQVVAAAALDPFKQFTAITASGPSRLQAREVTGKGRQHPLGPVPIRDIRRGDPDVQQPALGLDAAVSFAPFDALASVVATPAPFAVVWTRWLSKMAALGLRSRPSACLTCARNRLLIRLHTPRLRQRLTEEYTVSHFGRSFGILRQPPPLLGRYRIPLTISRIATRRGLPPGWPSGRSGSRIAHSSSLRSLGYARLFIPPV